MKWLLRLLAAGIVIAVVAGGAAAAWGWQQLNRPYRDFDGDLLITVEPGSSASAILRKLEELGVLADARLARAYLVYLLDDPSLKAGEYQFDEALSTPQVLDKLVQGQVLTYPVTLIEGLTLDEMAQILADSGFSDLETLRREMDRSDLIADLDPEATNLEGYLYPDTYHFARGTTAAEIVATMLRTFRRRFEEVQPLLPGPNQLTVRELVTLASIVEKEAVHDEERPRIAGVYANRLRIGMGLYADPTIIYAFKKMGDWDGNLRKQDLKIDSPYNTYLYPGLPPSPICSPGIASMLAAASPTESKELYFVSRNDGTHVFAETLQDHNRNVYRWQKRYWRERWARERQGK